MRRKKKRIPLFKKEQSYKQKLLADLNEKYPNYTLKCNLLGGMFLVGLILTIWEINIYRVTLISPNLLLAIWISTGLIATPLMKKTFNIYCFNPVSPGRTPIFFHILSNTVSFGGVLIFLFMWTNQNFTNHIKNIITANVILYGRLAKSKNSCGEPYVHISYKNKEKELVFPCGTEIEKYSRVYIEVERGILGFDVITNKTLIEGQW